MIVLDAESNGLLREARIMWTMTLYDSNTGLYTSYINPELIGHPGASLIHSKHRIKFDLSWQEVLNNADVLVGHNIEGYDLVLLEKLYGYRLPKKVKVRDTLIMSQVLDYKRFGNDGHSQAVWARSFGEEKQEHEDWANFSYEMLTRNVSDVRINIKMYDVLKNEFDSLFRKNKNIAYYLKAEQAVSRWGAQAELIGWPFDEDGAKRLSFTLAKELHHATQALESKLGLKAVIKDRLPPTNRDMIEKAYNHLYHLYDTSGYGRTIHPVDVIGSCRSEIRVPKWLRTGCYDSHTATWFNVDPWSGFEGEERKIAGPYCRVIFEKLKLSSSDDVKVFLNRNGWVPDDWNFKFDPVEKRKIKTSPKITDSSLEFLGADGVLYTEYLTTSSRYNVLKNWIEGVDDKGMLHGSWFSIGTPSMRARHQGIANVPSGELEKDGTAVSRWGPEIRRLFGTLPGWSLIGCDSAGNQARGLAHYLNSPEFTYQLLHGDIHEFNKDTANKVIKEIMKLCHVVTRPVAKRLLYAFLFGAGGDKLWLYITGSRDTTKGNKFKKEFTKAVPGFSELLDKLVKIFKSTQRDGGLGWIPGLAGNRIYVDSMHKLLVYLLQACEKVTCSAALMLTVERLEAEGIPYIPCIMYHDEIQFMVEDKNAERAAEIGKQAFADGPKLFGVTIMDGSAKIGKNWFDTH